MTTPALSPASAGLFMAACGISFTVISAHSSPWEAESASPEKAQSCREYTLQACAVNAAIGTGASLLAGTWWPLAGVLFVSAVMYWTYQRATSGHVMPGLS